MLCVCMDFCRMGLQLLGILERDERAFMSVRLFLYLQTMEKLQLYSHQKLCYNSLVSELRGALGRNICSPRCFLRAK